MAPARQLVCTGSSGRANWRFDCTTPAERNRWFKGGMMKRTLVYTACATYLAVAGVIAQEAPQQATPRPEAAPTQQTPSTTPAQPATPASPSARTVTGCIERASAAPSGGAASGSGAAAGSASTAKEGDFVLVQPPAASASGAAGATGTSGSASKTVMYRLSGNAAQLTPHVGHKVEISGSMSPATGGGAAGASGSSSSSATPPSFTVTAVKMVSATCTQ